MAAMAKNLCAFRAAITDGSFFMFGAGNQKGTIRCGHANVWVFLDGLADIMLGGIGADGLQA